MNWILKSYSTKWIGFKSKFIFCKKSIWIFRSHYKSSFQIKNYFCPKLIETVFDQCRSLQFLIKFSKSYFQLTLVKIIFDRSWLEYFRPTSTREISADIGPNNFRPTSTMIIFQLTLVSAFCGRRRSRMFLADLKQDYFLVEVDQGFQSMSVVDIFWSTLTKGFQSVSIVTIFLVTLVRVFVADIGKVFFGRCRSLIFFGQHQPRLFFGRR